LNEAQTQTEPVDPILNAIHEAACKRKAFRPVALDLRPLTPFTDYFYVCHSESQRQSRAISEAVQDALDEAGHKPYHVEGGEAGDWILIDAGEVVIHIFHGEATREFFSLERLWTDAGRLPLPEATSSP
jgi:ribosome-associated protein